MCYIVGGRKNNTKRVRIGLEREEMMMMMLLRLCCVVAMEGIIK
jgi:hypothetical protein